MAKNLLTITTEMEKAHLVQRAENIMVNLSQYAQEGNVSAFKSLENRYSVLVMSMNQYGISREIISNYNTRIKLFSIKMKNVNPTS